MTLETLIINACSWLEYRDHSGYLPDAANSGTTLSANHFLLNINESAKWLKIIHKTNGAAVWYKHNADDVKIVTGKFSDDDLTANDPSTFDLTATVSDLNGHFLPRRVALTLADKSKHAIALYRSAKGTIINQSGGLRGAVTTKSGDKYTPVPWALITAMVTPETGAALKFVAQADQHGEFLLPLNGPKLLTSNDVNKKYDATFAIEAPANDDADQAPNPDTFAARQVCNQTLGNGTLQFAHQLDVKITAGGINKLTSPSQPSLVLQAI